MSLDGKTKPRRLLRLTIASSAVVTAGHQDSIRLAVGGQARHGRSAGRIGPAYYRYTAP